tara:strand:- start:402 stop:752 length:351 start_codon:yes stop_codon:yes gene_type:complete
MKSNSLNIVALLCSSLFLIKCNDSSKDPYQLYHQNCAICHSLDGADKLGPSLKGIYGKSIELNDGAIAVADDEYILNSIIYPNKDIVKGYSGSMPSFEDDLSSDEIDLLIDFIKKY